MYYIGDNYHYLIIYHMGTNQSMKIIIMCCLVLFCSSLGLSVHTMLLGVSDVFCLCYVILCNSAISVNRDGGGGMPNLFLHDVKAGKVVKSLIQKKQQSWYALNNICIIYYI